MKFTDYLWYIKSQGLFLFVMFLAFFILFQGVQIYANIWLADMSKDEKLKEVTTRALTKIYMASLPKVNGTAMLPSETPKSPSPTQIEELMKLMDDSDKDEISERVGIFMLVYFLLGVVQMLFVGLSNVVFAFMAAHSSRIIHKSLLGIVFP